MTTGTRMAQVSTEAGGERHGALRPAIAILALLAVVMVVIMAVGLKRYPKMSSAFHDGQIKSPVLATELAGNGKYLKEVFQQTENPARSLNDARDPEVEKSANSPTASEAETTRWNQAAAVSALRTNTWQDCVFIPLYSGLLLCLALLFAADPGNDPLERRQPSPAIRKWLGRIGVALAVATALLDYAENYGILRATTASAITGELAQRISLPSLAKWSSLGVDLVLLGVLIWLTQLANFRGWVRRLLGAGFAITGVGLVVATQRLPLFAVATPSFAGLILISAAGLSGPFFRKSARGETLPGK